MASGDYLYAVAQRYNLTVDDLTTVNSGLTKTSTLSLGQVGAGGFSIYSAVAAV